MLSKRRKLVITTEQIIQCSGKSNGLIPRQQNTYDSLRGITKSLLVDSQNFILHFRNQACMELYGEDRDEIIELIQQLHWLKVQKKDAEGLRLKVFGVSSRFLTDFITSEKDLLRKISRMPSDYYLLEEGGAAPAKGSQSQIPKNAESMLEDVEDIDEFFDFVLIDKEEISKKLG
mmetsp:Transcript_27/g.50  ORF Transcript_27/g.50 Transcript_27/m.50 type:complete len:175 (-) Transcript_27:664-1188(-)